MAHPLPHPTPEIPARDTRAERVEAARHAARRLLASRRGMSLVEVMVVIAIILTLMGIIGFGVMSIFQDSKVDTTKLTMGKVNERVQIYYLRKKSDPPDLKTVYGSSEVPVDSWGNEFVFMTPGPNDLEYDLVSLGADGREGGAGNNEDIRWSDISGSL